jgi:hypothetical protein
LNHSQPPKQGIAPPYLLKLFPKVAIWPLATIGGILSQAETHALALLQRPATTHFRMFTTQEMATTFGDPNVQLWNAAAVAVLLMVPQMLWGDHHRVRGPVGWLTRPLWRNHYAVAVTLCLARVWLTSAVWNHAAWQLATVGEEGWIRAETDIAEVYGCLLLSWGETRAVSFCEEGFCGFLVLRYVSF